jgi:hypothetical protein
MKLHVVAASEILSKGLDPYFPHSQLGEDGLLVVPTETRSAPPAILISEVKQESQPDPVPVDVSEPVELVQESVEVSEPEIKQEPVVETIPAEDEKKPGKPQRGKKAH